MIKKALIGGCSNGGIIFIAGNYVARDLCSQAGKKTGLWHARLQKKATVTRMAICHDKRHHIRRGRVIVCVTGS